MTERTEHDETTQPAVGTVYATAYDPFTALTTPPLGHRMTVSAAQRISDEFSRARLTAPSAAT